LLVTAQPALADEVRRGGFSTGCHALDGLSYVAGGLQSSGALVEWFLDTFLSASSDVVAGHKGSAGGSARASAKASQAEVDRYAHFVALLNRSGRARSSR